jgi:hypothetical protein
MRRIPLVVHERRATWARQLRPRVVNWPVRFVESRSASDLASALAGQESGLVLVDLATRALAALEELAAGLAPASHPLVLVLDPERLPGIANAARELGATEVWSGPVAPPRVVDRLERWVNIARHRTASAAFSQEIGPFESE